MVTGKRIMQPVRAGARAWVETGLDGLSLLYLVHRFLAYFAGWTKPAPTHPSARIVPHGMKNPRTGKSTIKR